MSVKPLSPAPVQRLVGQMLLLQHQLDLMKAAYGDMKRHVERFGSPNETCDSGVGFFMKDRFYEWDCYLSENWSKLPNDKISGHAPTEDK